MSTADKHRLRSHRSYRNSVAVAEGYYRNSQIKYTQRQAMKTQMQANKLSILGGFKNAIDRIKNNSREHKTAAEKA